MGNEETLGGFPVKQAVPALVSCCSKLGMITSLIFWVGGGSV